MTLPYDDPAALSFPTPYFQDNTFVRGDYMRSNNQKIWGNLESLDGRVTVNEAEIAALNLTYLKYGVTNINPISTIRSQFTTIVDYVSSKNLAYNKFAPENDTQISSYTTESVSGTSTQAISSVNIGNGNIFIGVRASSTTYNFYIHNPYINSIVAAGTPSITVTNTPTGYISMVTLQDGNVFIGVKGGATDYDFYIYNSNTNLISSAGTASLMVVSTSQIYMSPLPNGNVLIGARASTTTYNFYIYDSVGDSISAAGTPTITVTSPGALSMSLLPSGNVFIGAVASSTTYNFYIYDSVGDSISAAGTPTVTVTGIGGINLSIISNGNVIIGCKSTGTTYNFYIYDSVGDSISAAGTSVITTTGVPTGRISISYSQKGNMLISIEESSSVYGFYLATGSYGPSNIYQYPIDLLMAGLV